MRMILLVLLAGWVIAFAIALFFQLAMLGHVRSEGNSMAKVLWLGLYTPREAFTDKGWRYRTIASSATNTGMVLFALWGLAHFAN